MLLRDLKEIFSRLIFSLIYNLEKQHNNINNIRYGSRSNPDIVTAFSTANVATCLCFLVLEDGETLLFFSTRSSLDWKMVTAAGNCKGRCKSSFFILPVTIIFKE